MQRNMQIGLALSGIIHLAAFFALGRWASQEAVAPTSSVPRGVISLAAAWAAESPDEFTKHLHVHAPGIPHDHDHPDRMLAVHSHAVDKSPAKPSAEPPSPRESVDLAVSTPAAIVPSRRTAIEPSVPTEGMPSRSSASTRPRQSTRRDLTTRDLVAAAIPSSASAAPGAAVDALPVRDATNPVPPYPAEAYAAGRQGRVVLEVDIDDTGRVTSVRVVESSGYAPFDHSARVTIRKWKFQPARRGGNAIAYSVRVPVRFAIRGD